MRRIFAGVFLLLLVPSISWAQWTVYSCPRCGGYHAAPLQWRAPPTVAVSRPGRAPATSYAPGRGLTGRRGCTVIHSWGSGPKLQAAIASAMYRAERGIGGHCYIDRRHTSGVGWTSNRNQALVRTCYWRQRHRGAYACVSGPRGSYSTLIL